MPATAPRTTATSLGSPWWPATRAPLGCAFQMGSAGSGSSPSCSGTARSRVRPAEQFEGCQVLHACLARREWLKAVGSGRFPSRPAEPFRGCSGAGRRRGPQCGAGVVHVLTCLTPAESSTFLQSAELRQLPSHPRPALTGSSRYRHCIPACTHCLRRLDMGIADLCGSGWKVSL